MKSNMVEYLVDFRDNPKLGDGKTIVRHRFNTFQLNFRDNPKLGDGKKILYFA